VKAALKIAWKMLISGNFKIRYVWDFIVGEYRMYLTKPYYKNGFIALRHPEKVRKHIAEQFIWRLEKTDEKCKRDFSCKHCGCSVPNLQFANRECEGGCYPKMMNQKEWEKYVQSN